MKPYVRRLFRMFTMGRLQPGSLSRTLRLLSIMILLAEHHFRECIGESIEKLYLGSELNCCNAY